MGVTEWDDVGMWRRIRLLISTVVLVWLVVPGHIVIADDWLSPLRQGGLVLPFDEVVYGELNNEAYRNVYFFSGSEGEIVEISMARVDGDLDPLLLLTDEQGVILAVSDDDGPGVDASVPFFRLPNTGRFFVVATRFGQLHGGTSGDYSLLLERMGGRTENTEVLRFGDSVQGHISAAEPRAFYFVRGERGDVINIVMRRTSGSLDPRVDLSTADGVVLISNDDDLSGEGSLDAAIRGYTVLEDGVYLIVATRFGDVAGVTEGSFTLTVTRTPVEELGLTPTSARLIDYDVTLNGAIDDAAFARYFRFQAERGDVVTVTLTSEAGNLDPLLILMDANQVELTRDDDGGDTGRDARIAGYSLPGDGIYYLVATRALEETGQTEGDFALYLSGRPGIMGGRALEITYGAVVSGQIDDQTVVEEYVFFGSEGDVIRVMMEGASGDLDSLITLFDSERKQIAFDDDSGDERDALIERFTLPRDGLYFLNASRFDREAGTTRGAYVLSLELLRVGE